MGIKYASYTPKVKKHSYSSINTYDQCSFRYYLQYILGNYFYTDNIAADFGTLCHYILENIGLDLKAGRKPDYDKYKDEFQNINIPKKNPFDKDGGIYGLKALRDKYKAEFIEANKNGQSYYTKGLDFIANGMYSLERRLEEHPTWKVWACEQYFDITILNCRFAGFIDRIFVDETTGEYIIEDIKTKDHPFRDEELTTPLQFVIYVKALSDMLGIAEDKISCAYDLPICHIRQEAGTKGFIKRGINKLQKIIDGISQKDFKPTASPLCYYCPFCRNNPVAPEEGKKLCPYYSLWKPDNRTFDVANLWEGMERHEVIVKRLDNIENPGIIEVDF